MKPKFSSGAQPQYFPPIAVGVAGSIIFFATLFGSADPTDNGYSEFRKCHMNCVNGILHAFLMPAAVCGVFFLVRAFTASSSFTRWLQAVVTSLYFIIYLRHQHRFERASPWLFYIAYMVVFDRILYARFYVTKDTMFFLTNGILLIALNVGALEVVGHGMLEHHHSYVSEFFNSVFHTPIYGIESVLHKIGLNPTHECW